MSTDTVGLEKATATAPANIAFVKYWGAVDLERALPVNRSISMTLSHSCTRCTVLPREDGSSHEVYLVDETGDRVEAPEGFAGRVLSHLDRLRGWAGYDGFFRVATRNNFPMATGLGSSASGFAALTLATTRALGRELSPRTLSVLSRRSGSGSAARSAMGGYVEWPGGDVPDVAERGLAAPEDDSGGHARVLAPAEHWDLRDVVAVVETGAKPVPSVEGHRRAGTSPYYERRLELLPDRLERVRRGIRERDLELLGAVLEREAVDLHLVAMSSRPPIFYWTGGTLEVIREVRAMREDGVNAYFSIDAGPNVHVICEPDLEDAVAGRLGSLAAVRTLIRDGVGQGPIVSDDHLL